MQPNLGDYGIDLAMVQDDPIGAIKLVLSQYEEAAKNYRDSGEKQTTGIKAIQSAILSDSPATVNLADSLITRIRGIIYEVLLNDPAVSVLLFNDLQELKEGVSAFRQEAIKTISLGELPEEDDDLETTEMKFEEVEFLHKALSNFINFAQMNGLPVRDLPSEVRTLNKKSNKQEVKLPRKPNGPETKEGDSVKGKHAAIYQMLYKVNGEDVPKGTGLNRLALFYCSTPDVWINGSELMDLVLKETGESWGSQEAWTVKVPMGTLSAIRTQK